MTRPWVALALAGIALAACDGTPGGPLPVATAQSSKARVEHPAVSTADATALAEGNTAFALSLYATLKTLPGNIVFSPASISLALAMTYAGARSATAAQMAAALVFTLPPERLHPAMNALSQALGARATLANDLWVDRAQKLEPAFLDTLAQNYGAGIQLVDIGGAPEAARLTINRWVADQTAGRIGDLLPPGLVTAVTRLVLTNAVYLNAAWKTPFSGPTMSYPFHRADGSEVNVPMMLGKTGFAMTGGAGYRAAELEYADGALSMVVIVPDLGTFAEFESVLTPAVLASILDGLAPATDGLLLPRWTFSLAVSLGDTLANLGMPDAFSPSYADFSGMDGTRDLFIRDVVEEAFISVTEQGTEAGAATGVVVATHAALAALAVDRPFLFVIRVRPTGALLFAGRVVDPSATP